MKKRRADTTHPYDEACEFVLKSNQSEDAKSWLNGGDELSRVLAEYDSAETRYVIENAYAMGADRVRVIGSAAELRGQGSPGMLLIDLPDRPADRARLFGFERQVAEETGFYPSMDEGQQFLLIRWT